MSSILLQTGYAGYAEKCSKCGGNTRLRYWTPTGWRGPDDPEEAILHTCQVCGYQWKTPTLDALRRGDSPKEEKA